MNSELPLSTFLHVIIFSLYEDFPSSDDWDVDVDDYLEDIRHKLVPYGVDFKEIKFPTRLDIEKVNSMLDSVDKLKIVTTNIIMI